MRRLLVLLALTPMAGPPAATAAVRRPVASRPPIVWRAIPYGPARKAEMAAYAQRHYGHRTARLTDRKVIVEHYTVTTMFAVAYAAFAADVPDPELHELPGTCAHFVVDRDGTIYQLVSLRLMCRHTVGLNDVAIGIEQVGRSAQEILARPAQRRAIARLSAWLRCRYDIRAADVIGHAMSLESPYHHERVPALRRQAHADWNATELARLKRQITRYACR